jgi:hypothetical protein
MLAYFKLDARRSHLPFLIAAAAYLAATTLILLASLHATGGHFIYALDDTYINMAMAKNFALHGVWGVTPYEFSSSTSSPFYVLLLSAVYWFTGPLQYAPLVLSWIFGLASIYVAAQIVADYLTDAWQATILVAMVMVTPLFAIGTLGMEHSLHLFLTLLFLQAFDKDAGSSWTIAVITSLMVATRYEGMFMAAVAVLIWIAQRKWSRAAIVAAAAWLPVCVYTLFSVAHGGYWLPNSVAIKGLQAHGFSSGRLLLVFMTVLSNSLRGFHLFLLLAGIAVAAVSLRHSHPRVARMLALVAGTGCLHLIAADVGWAFRYEDYLIGAGVIAAACAFPALRRSSKMAVLSAECLFLCAAVCLVGRTLQAATLFPQYSRRIYLQQWQMAAFLKTYYPRQAIAANDIGAINFRGDFHCLDMIGLASADVFAARRSGSYSTQFLDKETRSDGTKIAVIYDSWFSVHPKGLISGPPVPASWTRVRRWRVPPIEQLGEDTISFYALDPAEARHLSAHLDAFESTLPSGVTRLPF